jgi:hypothetical protein
MSIVMDESERRPIPTLLLVILALFGLASIPNFTGSAPRSDSSEGAKKEQKTAAAESASRAGGQGIGDQPEARILGPLLDYYRSGADGVDSRDAAFTRSRYDGLVFLIATVPDPVRGTNSNRFDEWIGTIQRACESEGFVLDGFRLPWGTGATAEPKAKTDAGTSTQASRSAAEPAGVTSKARIDAGREQATSDSTREPGLLLFRGQKTPGPIRVTPLLAVLLVPETPTLGLDKMTMRWSLDLAAAWDARNRPWFGAKTLHILGPIFSGSQTSLERALAGWTSRVDAIKYVFDGLAVVAVSPATFRVISGGASAMDVDGLKKCVAGPNTVEFSATVHQSDALLDAVLDYFGGPRSEVAMLVEANTQFGLNMRAEKTGEVPVFYPFPLHISKVRGYYQKQGYLRDQSSGTLRSFEQLTIPFDQVGDASDTPPMQTPGFTTVVDELVLGQILADIARRDIRTVGIIATDPLDTIFLAREVRKYIPDIRLFTTESDLLYMHPQNIDDLRGMLVASTYPLFPPNQSWSYSYRGDVTHVFFSSDSIQGTYNAAIAHLEVLGDPRYPAGFLEYGEPFDPPGSYSSRVPAIKSGPKWIEKKRTPPVWVSVVGNHGLYPVRVVTEPRDHDPNYLYQHKQPEEEYTGMLRLPPPWQLKEQADSWRRIHDWFRPEFPQLWIYLFAGSSAACLAWAGLGILVYRWAAAGMDAPSSRRIGLGPFSMVRLARFLNCCRGEDAVKAGHGWGPGPYLPIALALLLLVYLVISAPHLEAIWRVPWIRLDPWQDVGFWVGSIAYAVLWLVSISLVVSVVTWRTRGRRVRDGKRASAATTITTARRLPRRVLAVLLGLVILGPPVTGLLVGMFQSRIAYSFPGLDSKGLDLMIRLARWMAIPTGVSPVLPMLFIGVAGLAWVHAQLKRRFLFEKCTPAFPSPSKSFGASRPTGDAHTMQLIREECELIDEMLESPAWPFRKLRLIRLTAVTAFILLFIPLFVVPVVIGSLPACRDAMAFSNAVAGWLILAIFGLLGFHAVQLVILWRHVRKVMGLMVHLPLVSALDRIPSRVAAWLKKPPKPDDGRFELIQRQALALAELGEADHGAVRGEDAILLRRFSEKRWKAIHEGLKRLRPVNVDDAIVPIRDYLLEHWRPMPVETVFPDAETDKTETAGQSEASSEPHAIANAGSEKEVPVPHAPKRLPQWVHLAEDLLAMLFMRWLAAALAQVWTLISFLVVGSVGILFAISSYPFPFQERLLIGVAALAAVLVFMILAVVVGFNRDEMISRLSNTVPNRLKFDQQLWGHLITYIVPLVGALAAISPDASDMLRSLLDPIFRHFR